MPPLPKPPAKRQRRNRTATSATLEAPPVEHAKLPGRTSPKVCAAAVDRKSGCPLPATDHDLEHFAKHMIEVHQFVAAELEWHALTLVWWDTIWKSPMVEEWVDADVPGLVNLAMLWDDFYRWGDPRTHGEARLASREFGLTPMSRRGLQWEIRRVEGVKPKPTVPARPRRTKAGKPILAALDGGLSSTRRRKATGS